MKRRMLHISITVLFAAAMILHPACAATAAELAEVRAGRHQDFQRIVFEFTGDVQYQVLEDDVSGEVSVIFFEVSSPEPPPKPAQKPDCIERFDLLQQGKDLLAGVVPASAGAAVNHFSIKDPVRVVLDVYCRAGEAVLPAQPTSEIPAVPAVTLAAPTPADELVPDKKSEPPSPEVTISPVLGPSPPQRSEDAIFQKYMITILAALSILIIVLAGVIIFQGRSQTAKALNGGSAVKLKVSEDKLLSIDAKIREKLRTQGKPRQA